MPVLYSLLLLLISFATLASTQAFGSEHNPAGNFVDTSSPQATLDSFLAASDTLITHWQGEEFNSLEAQVAFYQSARTLDLSGTANRTRDVVVMEKIILLREVLNRMDVDNHANWPAYEDSDYHRWRLNGTDLTIERQQNGHLAGQYLFSERSINQLARLYNVLKLSQPDSLAEMDLYQEFIHAPGPLIPRRWINQLPDWSHQLYLAVPLWQWFFLLAMTMLSVKILKLNFRLGSHWNKRWSRSNPGKQWQFGRQLALILTMVWVTTLRRLLDDGIWLYGHIYQMVSTFFLCIQFIFLTWFVLSIFIYLAHVISQGKNGADAPASSLILVLAKIFGVIVVVIFSIYALEYLGMSISPIVAGLGVGGLAIALAIRPLLENVINGLTLYADGGVKVGELCRYGGKNLIGVIENIGLRSTRIRTLERSLITIPNSEFANMEIDNLERRDKRRMEHVLRLRPELSREQLQVLLANLRREFLRHPKVEAEPLRARLSGVGSYSVDLNILVYVRSRDNEEFMAIQEDLLFTMLKQVEQAGATLAFSTQHQYAGKLKPSCPKLSSSAKQTVAKWHSQGDFPFPNFSYSYTCQIKDSKVFPAPTSAVHKNHSPGPIKPRH